MFTPPYYPIIYVRGYAGNDSEIEDTVADPYMGFNLGSTKQRQAWTGDMQRYYFESPLVRLMKEFDYRDIYSAGVDHTPDGRIAPRSVVVYRYYDQVSDSFGSGEQLRMEVFGAGLGDLILKLREQTCADATERAAFKVHLVGHSMGGLVIRCFLQNHAVSTDEARSLVDKVFTYATPHNGIELAIVGNVPSFFTRNSADNFNRVRMCEYLALPAGTDPVNTLAGRFDPDRFFCLIGTNARDYAVAAGWSARVVGPFSDGLVRINNAVVSGTAPDAAADSQSKLAPRAYVNRSHSGPYGIVNSEEGYQNLVRFLFGDIRVDGVLEVAAITLPDSIQALKTAGRQVRASYHFEAVTTVRGAHWDLSRRLASENSTVFRRYGELFPDKPQPGDRPDHASPELFTTFLRNGARVDQTRPSLGFSVDLGVLVPEYQVDGALFLKDHYAGSYIFRDKLTLEATPGDPWTLMYGFDSVTPNAAPNQALGTPVPDGFAFRIPVKRTANPGIDATLVLTAKM
jgi:pimeloyl-ACP methyl ester carboxylesterase